MAGISRVGDATEAGGTLMTGAEGVFINGIPVALHVCQVTPHAPWGRPHPPHHVSRTTDGSPSVFAEGKPVVRIGSGTTCGHKVIGGSSDTNCP